MCTLEPSLTCSLQVPSIRSHYQKSIFMLPKSFTLSFDLPCNMTRRRLYPIHNMAGSTFACGLCGNSWKWNYEIHDKLIHYQASLETVLSQNSIWDGIYPSCSVEEVLHFWSNIHVTPRDGNGLSKSLHHFSHRLQHHKVILTLDPPPPVLIHRLGFIL